MKEQIESLTYSPERVSGVNQRLKYSNKLTNNDESPNHIYVTVKKAKGGVGGENANTRS